MIDATWMPHPHEGEHLSSLRSTDPLPDWVSARRRAIGDRIRAARTHRNLTQEGLAELAGLDRKTVNRVEEGAHSPLLDHLLLIADALGVPLADLVREE